MKLKICKLSEVLLPDMFLMRESHNMIKSAKDDIFSLNDFPNS